MKYTATVEADFKGESKCNECKFRYEKQERMTSNSVICRLNGKYLMCFQNDPMCFGGGYRKSTFEGDKPDWCPLQRVELENM